MKTTTTLLHLGASPRGGRSHRRKLGREFLAADQLVANAALTQLAAAA